MKLLLTTLLCLKLIQISFSCVFLKLDDGIIKGRLAAIPETTSTFYAFQEIPYAAPPIGKLRFQPPQPVTKWNGILDTTENTKICYQVEANRTKENEDCLYLNVYTPKLPTRNQKGELLPVMVYIYGGGFIIGDATHQSYGPEFLISHGVIVVTLNYGVGPFGFLSTQDEIIPGNNGLKDQFLALKWVNKNINLFGGDPQKVTIFGQSAGAASVGYHLLNKKSQGLYRAAIMESGSPLCPFSYQRDAKQFAIKTASYINPEFNEKNSSWELLQVMLQASAEDIDAASERIVGEEKLENPQLFQGYYYAPVLESAESEGAYLTEEMYENLVKGGANQVPLVIGINSEEGLSQTTDLAFLKKIMAGYDNHLDFLVPHDMNVEGDKTSVGEEIRKLYVGDGNLTDDPGAGIRYMSDTGFTRPVITHASIQSKFSDVYFYQFSYDGKIGNVSVVINGAERVGHNEENAYLWRINSAMFNNYNSSIYPEDDILTRNRLLGLWTNFAKNLNPTPVKSDLLQNIVWPKISASDKDLHYLNIDKDLEIRSNPKNQTYSGWVEIYNKYGKRPFDTY